jgi:hypothetical protein
MSTKTVKAKKSEAESTVTKEEKVLKPASSKAKPVQTEKSEKRPLKKQSAKPPRKNRPRRRKTNRPKWSETVFHSPNQIIVKSRNSKLNA